MNVSRKIELDGTKNLRDLGGIRTKSGKRIREGALLRSDSLHALSGKDVETLASIGLRCAYDFRNDVEQKKAPDREIPGCLIISDPVFPEKMEGVTHDEEDQFGQYIRFVEQVRNNLDVEELMKEDYRTFVTSEHSRNSFHFFLTDLLRREKEAQEKGERAAFLWHCAAGKDRTGFAAALLEFIFGVPKEDILDDYVLTSRYVNPGIQELTGGLTQQMKDYYGDRYEETVRMVGGAVKALVDSRKEYLEASWEKAEEMYGSFSSFITEGLAFSQADQEEMRRIFLE